MLLGMGVFYLECRSHWKRRGLSCFQGKRLRETGQGGIIRHFGLSAPGENRVKRFWGILGNGADGFPILIYFCEIRKNPNETHGVLVALLKPARLCDNFGFPSKENTRVLLAFSAIVNSRFTFSEFLLQSKHRQQAAEGRQG